MTFQTFFVDFFYFFDLANRIDVQDMEINLQYRKSKKSQQRTFGMSCVFEINFYSVGLENGMDGCEKYVSDFRKSFKFF